jgi:hypothetical protein
MLMSVLAIVCSDLPYSHARYTHGRQSCVRVFGLQLQGFHFQVEQLAYALVMAMVIGALQD